MKRENLLYLILVLGVLLVAYVFYIDFKDRQLANQVKDGELALFCYTNKGNHQIDKEDVVFYSSSQELWSFTNGYSFNCYLMKGGKEYEPSI